MNNYERYYRRSYNALEKLIKAYRNGYYIHTMNEYRTTLIIEGINKQNVFREDVVTNGDAHAAILANAPEKKEGTFVVPKTLETGGESNESNGDDSCPVGQED